jgi:hypothetical protein
LARLYASSYPYSTTVVIYDLSDQSQTDTVAMIAFRREVGLEYCPEELERDTMTVVRYKNVDLILPRSNSQPNGSSARDGV